MWVCECVGLGECECDAAQPTRRESPLSVSLACSVKLFERVCGKWLRLHLQVLSDSYGDWNEQASTHTSKTVRTREWKNNVLHLLTRSGIFHSRCLLFKITTRCSRIWMFANKTASWFYRKVLKMRIVVLEGVLGMYDRWYQFKLCGKLRIFVFSQDFNMIWESWLTYVDCKCISSVHASRRHLFSTHNTQMQFDVWHKAKPLVGQVMNARVNKILVNAIAQ